MTEPWTKPIRLNELGRGGLTLRLEPDADQRAALAKQLLLVSLPSLSADLTVKPWLDGAEITGRFRALVEQTCGISLETFEQPVEGEIQVRLLPSGSPHAQPAQGGEVELDLEAPDPPDLLEHDHFDLAAYVVEHLGLEIDPFPRKPGVEFDYAPPTEEVSPFAVLRKLTDPKD
ncbi:DUF177 domain-containing protein [Phenylobacterium sp.]|uniref:DUF177 domain-containing protein n=1 Tax=Phenylobacterium sp. TaxID=1871053 RepID=UPI0039832C59